PKREEVEQNRIRRMQDKIGEMVAERVHAPYNVIEPQRHPGKRLVMTHEERGEHPAEISPTEAPEMGVFKVERVVVVIDEAVVEGRIKSRDAEENQTGYRCSVRLRDKGKARESNP